jgi:hypothetical protein
MYTKRVPIDGAAMNLFRKQASCIAEDYGFSLFELSIFQMIVDKLGSRNFYLL